MNKGQYGKILAFFDIKTQEGFVIKGFKIGQGDGFFVGFPSQKGNDNEYYDTIYCSKELRQKINDLAIEYYKSDKPPFDDGEDSELMVKDALADKDVPF